MKLTRTALLNFLNFLNFFNLILKLYPEIVTLKNFEF